MHGPGMGQQANPDCPMQGGEGTFVPGEGMGRGGMHGQGMGMGRGFGGGLQSGGANG
jgi:hypothetical protein